MTYIQKCTAECWTPVPCPTCGRDLLPRGRSAPMEMSIVSECCGEAMDDSLINPRHLWDENDSDRAYFDPDYATDEKLMWADLRRKERREG